jgi:lycopene beta-cyclase
VCDKATDSHLERAPRSEQEAAAMSAAVWGVMWPVQRLRQRAFFEFGMDVLLKLDLAETRQFFAAFFSLSDHHWHGFLSSRLSFSQLIAFGLSLFAKSSNAARANLLAKGLPGLVVMLARLVTLK